MAACARPLVAAAAQAGFGVAALDIFNDVETRRFCWYSAPVRYGERGFDAADLLAHLQALPPAPVIYGSGLEQQPELLQAIAGRQPVIGNVAAVVAQVNNPRHFFSLLAQLHIPYPPTCWNRERVHEGWLLKRAGAAGGTHIRRGGLMRDEDYAQQEMPGKPVSLLFLSDAATVQVIGFNEQWLAPESGFPFCYGGAVSQAAIPEKIQAQMTAAARQIAAAAGLRGLNSMDGLWAADSFFVLEVNPRPSATFALYDSAWLLRQHIRACTGRLDGERMPPQPARAQKIIFAAADTVIPERWPWPQWATDIPPPGSIIQARQPLCCAGADGADADAARALVFARAGELEAQLEPLWIKGLSDVAPSS